jgi:hypothetical protein
MSSLPTPRDYAAVHAVDAGSVACDHWARLDLPALIAAGYGDVPLTRLPLGCWGVWGNRMPGAGHRAVIRAGCDVGDVSSSAPRLPASSPSARSPCARR